MPERFDWAWVQAALPSIHETQLVNHGIHEVIRLKQEAMFEAWLEERGLNDYRIMPPGEARTREKHRTFAALYGAED